MKTRRTNDESGIALVVTLILMAVALVMAVAFLAISRRAKGSVATQTNGTAARYAADAALAGAEAQIVATIMSGGTNTHGQIAADPCGFGLVVSTNDISTNAFSQPACVGFANVSYYYANGNVVGGDDFNQVLTNLYYDPRVPVMISSNEPAGRFYLDLNRNGKFDANGFAADVISNGVGVVTNGNSFHVGDPEWIGILEHPDAPYGPDNPAVARYAFIAVPVGNALDLNAIHNQAMVVMNNQSRYRAPVNPMTRGQDYFFRNQGVGSWELNLAAFLADLDTNQWGAMVGSGPTPPGYDANFYWYNYPLAGRGYQGYAFDDAFSLITNRYAANYDSLATNVFNGVGDIDYYNDGPLMTGFSPISETFYVRGVPPPWVGSDNTNHFFDEPDDLFDPAQSSAGFVQRLTAAGAAAATYDRYSYYRLLSQLGTDSDPDSGKMNLNYDNVDANGSVVDGAETNFISWTPLGFFTNAANRLLLAYTADWAANYVPTNNGVMIPVLNSNFWATFSVTNAFGVGDIPVLVSNRFVYTPAVQRLLQLAANMYDATTNNTYNGSPDWPDVFRPLFSRDTNGNVFITGYTNVYPMGQMNGYPVESTNGYPLALPVDVTSLPVNVYNMVTNVYGVPWIVGAKKGYPNFNKFQLQTIFSMTRKLQYTRTTAGPRITIKADPGDYTLSQELLLSVTNLFGVECWNSYSNDFKGRISISVTGTNIVTLTNDEGALYRAGASYADFISPPTVSGTFTNLSDWEGYNPSSSTYYAPLNFIVPFNTQGNTNLAWSNSEGPPNSPNVAPLPDATYRFDTRLFDTSGRTNFYKVPPYLQPQWTLLTTNRFRVIIFDQDGSGIYHVIDYVQLAGPDSTIAATNYVAPGATNTVYDAPQWDTNLIKSGIPWGFANQLAVSQDQPRYYVDPSNNHIYDWGGSGAIGEYNVDPTMVYRVEDEIDGFEAFLGSSLSYPNVPGESNIVATAEQSTNQQVPFTPTETIVKTTKWEANDPLVHYTASDLTDLNQTANELNYFYKDPVIPPLVYNKVNSRYMPWGGPSLSAAGTDPSPFNPAFKDPGMWDSDGWNFPAAKLPTVGWLGRVHRGTPWQTVYLKASNILDETNAVGANIGVNTWLYWTGDGNLYDDMNSAPAWDRLLFDSFTTAVGDNSTRGQLSVNVGSAAGSGSLAAWSALFSGVQVLSNTAPDAYLGTAYRPPMFYTSFPIDPAGPQGYSSALGELAANIDQTRAAFTNRDGLVGVFEHAGDILASPALTEGSPFLHLSNYVAGVGWVPDEAQQTNGMNDAMYEWLPQQIMSLVRRGAPRYVIYCYGQALKPAPGGIDINPLNPAFFGMVTNYQVVAQSAARVVLRVEGTPPNAHVVIEQYNELPPD